MTSHLSAEQTARLESLLVARRQELDRELEELEDGQTRAEHAHELLLQDSDDAPRRESEREMELARIDHDSRERAAVDAALKRLRDGEFGSCADCGIDIPFARLSVEPWALRCVACESRREQAR